MLGLTDKILENKTLMYSAAALAAIVAALLCLLLFRLAFRGRLRLAGGGRSRQPRLGLVDAFDLDRQRQLIIVRRDNVEHLLMVGGPNDVLIEAQIVRAEAVRELARARDKEPDVRPALPVGVGTEPPMVASAPPNALPSRPAPPVVEPPAVAPPLTADVRAPNAPAPTVPVPTVLQPEAPEPTLDAAPSPSPDLQSAALPSTPPAKETPSRAPLFPLPPRRPLPPLGKPPVPRGDIDQPADSAPQQIGSLDMPAPMPRPGQLPPRPPSFLRPPPIRSAPRPVGSTPERAPVVENLPPVGEQTVPAVAPPPPPPVVHPALNEANIPPVATPVDKEDLFDTIEEEMAKLLGRSSDKG